MEDRTPLGRTVLDKLLAGLIAPEMALMRKTQTKTAAIVRGRHMSGDEALTSLSISTVNRSSPISGRPNYGLVCKLFSAASMASNTRSLLDIDSLPSESLRRW